MTIESMPVIGDVPPCTVPLRQVERELNRQLKTIQSDKGEAPVIRAGLSNLVIYCDSAERAAEVEAEVPNIVAIHPARILLLIHDPDGTPGPVTATVHTQMHRMGKGLRAFSEQVTLCANGRAAEHLPYAVRSLLIGDLPTNLWWASWQPPATAGAILYDLSENADQVIYDSYGWVEPAKGMTSMATWIEKFERGPGQGRYRVVSDLTWRRLKSWRRVLGQALDPTSAPGAVETVQEVVVDHGPHSVISAWSLASWMALCLGWKVSGAKVVPDVRIDWSFTSSTGAKHIQIRRLAEAPKGVRQLSMTCRMADKRTILVVTPEDEDQRLSVVVNGGDTAPRTMTVQPQSIAELVGKQLSDRDRDPIFQRAMSEAQALAQRVLEG